MTTSYCGNYCFLLWSNNYATAAGCAPTHDDAEIVCICSATQAFQDWSCCVESECSGLSPAASSAGVSYQLSGLQADCLSHNVVLPFAPQCMSQTTSSSQAAATQKPPTTTTPPSTPTPTPTPILTPSPPPSPSPSPISSTPSSSSTLTTLSSTHSSITTSPASTTSSSISMTSSTSSSSLVPASVTTAAPTHRHRLTSGAAAGIGVGCTIAGLLFLALIIFALRRHQKKKPFEESGVAGTSKPRVELGNAEPLNQQDMEELQRRKRAVELEGSVDDVRDIELDGEIAPRVLLEALRQKARVAYEKEA